MKRIALQVPPLIMVLRNSLKNLGLLIHLRGDVPFLCHIDPLKPSRLVSYGCS